ncbi:hypothetical protein ABPG75_000226 [Micractinium tetrahymenae]
MRRSALLVFRLAASGSSGSAAPQLAGRLGGALGAAGCSSALSTAAAGAAAAALPAAAACLTPWRSFSAEATEAAQTAAPADTPVVTTEQAPAEQQQQQQQQPRGAPRRRSEPRVSPDSDLGRLQACGSADDMRAWRTALENEGRFGADQLAALIRALGNNRQGLGDEERASYLRELLGEAAEGAVPLNGKAAAYLLWGPTKLFLGGSDPAVQAVLTAVFQHIDTMQSNDVTTTLWACGLMDIQPSIDAKEQLVARLQELLPTLKMKELTAAGVGLTRLGMPPSVVVPLVAAFEAKVAEMPDLDSSELERVVRLLPHLPGLQASSPFCQTLFEQLLRKARRVDLYALTEAVWAAGRLKYPLSEADLRRLLRNVEARLGENHGVQFQALLYGLDSLGCRAGQGALTHEFLEKCVDSQLQALEQRAAAGPRRQSAYVIKALIGLSMLRPQLPERQLQAMLGMLQAAGLETVQKPWLVQKAFRRLQFQPGVDALEPFTNYGEHAKKRRGAGDGERQEAGQQEQQDAAAV